MTSTPRGIVFSLARVTIEFKTAFLIAAGGGDEVHDAVFVTDANDLPVLPGSSIAGVLRNAFPENEAEILFGYQRDKEGQSSRIEVSWAQAHDQANVPVPFRLSAGASIQNDPVLSFLRSGVRRDHVRINERGFADDRGKFDELIVPAGARFTFEIVVDESGTENLDKVLNYLCSGVPRLGGKSRRGLGAFSVVEIWKDAFDLRERPDRERFLILPRDLAVPLNAHPLRHHQTPQREDLDSPRWITANVILNPEDFWFFGGGDAILPRHFRGDQPHDMVPVTERRIDWSSGKGQITDPQHRVPAAGIKGALRHRLAFHIRCLKSEFVEIPNDPNDWRDSPANESSAQEIATWFGNSKDRDDSGDNLAGRVSISDGWILDPRDGALDHVSLDRFTQGPKDGALFSEKPLFRGAIAVDIVIDREFGGRKPSKLERRAFQKTLDDLCRGRLALGAGGGRGHGYCTGRVTWQDGGDWIGGAE